MKICIAGKNQIAINAVQYLLETLNFSKEDVLICINKSDKGIDSWQPSFKLFANKNYLKIVSLNELYDIEDLIFISLEFDRIIKTKKFKTDKLFNIHFSLLPAYKGMYTSVLPILNGEEFSGVTLHKINDGIDTGDIIAYKKFKIEITDTARDLYIKYLEHGINLFKEQINDIISGNYNAKQQNCIGSTYYSKVSIDFNNIKIDLRKTSFQIHNQIRAFIFEEYQLPEINGKKIKKSFLTNEKIERNFYSEDNKKIILSGIDGFKIILETI